MKFCRTCGAQYNDDAVFCTNCGNVLDSAPVNPAPNPTPAYAPNMAYSQPAPAPMAPLMQPKKKQTGAVFGFLFNLCLLLYSVFSFLAVVYAYVSTSTYSYYAYSNFWFDETCVILSFVMAFPLLAFGIVSFVFGLKEKEDATKKFAGIFRFIAGIVLFIVSIIVMSVQY